MNSALRRHQKIIVLFICLFIHALFMTGIVVIQFKDDIKSPTIVFADLEPEHAKQAIPSADEEQQWVALSNAAPAPQQAPPIMQANEPYAEEHTAQLPQPSPAQEELQPAQEKPSQEEIALEKSMDEAITIASNLLKKVDPAPEKKEIEPAAQEKTPPIEQSPKKLTLATIAQGFMSQVQQQAAMAVQSDTQGTASMEQLKHINYCQKIISCLVNSYKINKYSAPKGEQPNRACVQLAIKEDGTIHSLRIVQSSGNPMLDQFLLDMFKDASSSFPPIPQSFSQKTYHLPLFNIDHIESFQTSQGWYIDNRRS